MSVRLLFSLIIISSLFVACSKNSAQISKTNNPKTANSNTAKTLDKSPPTAQILAPNEGEEIFYEDGRSVLLKASPKGNGSQNLLFGTETLPKGTLIPVHSHDDHEEIIFIHEGNAFLTLGDKRVEAEPGTTMYIPPGTWHGVESADPKQTTMLFIFPRTEIADFFREVGYKKGEKPPKLTGEDWQRILKKHKMRARRD